MFRPVTFLLAAVLVASAGSSAPADPPAKKEDEKKGIDRTGATRKRLLKDFGGSEQSEEAVMLGLAWLTQTQKPAGNWEFDGNAAHKNETAAATGMAVLAFLGAGQSHKEGRYKQTVQAGLDWLVKNLETDAGPTAGKFKGSTMRNGQIYGQGIAALALCEAYGMTQDPLLKYPAQAAIDYIQRIQAANGSWGYVAGTAGDTSIVGWQIQAMHAAKIARLNVDDKVVKKAIDFLNFAGAGQYKSMYGYQNSAGAQPATARTAIGLLCRYYIDNWRSDTAGFAEGSKGLMKRAPSATPRPPQLDLYYYYYATQVVRFYGGEEWKTWNEGPKAADGTRKGGVPEWLIGLQSKRDADRGSWDPGSEWIGSNCGRHGMTCLCLLTLEVYYRYDPNQQQGGEPKK
jgi:hypothetical protein